MTARKAMAVTAAVATLASGMALPAMAADTTPTPAPSMIMPDHGTPDTVTYVDDTGIPFDFTHDSDSGAWTLAQLDADTTADTLTVVHYDHDGVAHPVTLTGGQVKVPTFTPDTSVNHGTVTRTYTGATETGETVTLTRTGSETLYGFGLKTTDPAAPQSFTYDQDAQQWTLTLPGRGVAAPDGNDLTRTLVSFGSTDSPDTEYPMSAPQTVSHDGTWTRTWTWTKDVTDRIPFTQGHPIVLTETGVWPSIDQTPLDRAMADATGRIGTDVTFTRSSFDRVKAAYEKTQAMKRTLATVKPGDPTYPAQSDVDDAVRNLTDAVNALTVDEWEVDVDGKTAGVLSGDGTWTPASQTPLDGLPDAHTLTVRSTKDTQTDPETLTGSADGPETLTDVKPGQVAVSGRVRYTLPGVGGLDGGVLAGRSFTMEYTDTQGTAVDPGDVLKFKRDGQGVWQAAASYQLTQDNTVVDGDGHPIQPVAMGGSTLIDAEGFAPAETTGMADTRFVSRTLSRDGTFTVPVHGYAGGTPRTVVQRWHVTATAARSTDTHLTPILLDTRSDGTTGTVQLPDGNEDGTMQVTLPYERSTDAFTLTFDRGADAPMVDATVVQNGTARTWTWMDGGRRRTLTLTFDRAPLQPDSMAKLTGLLVDLNDGKGPHLIDGWDANRLSYTIGVAEDAPSPTVTPTWDGNVVSVEPTDVRQTADGASQSWKVTANAGGESRDYTVTVIRQRSWKTPAESFTPPDPVEREGVAAEDPSDVSLVDHGWQSGDRYAAVSDGRYEIPEGARFAYTLHAGQHASVTRVRLGGMTWRYTVRVLAADGVSHADSVFDVTFITSVTHAAALTGLLVDGKQVDGFDPGRFTYDVPVGDPDQWVVSPVFDRHGGMSVDTVKTGREARITVTSDDSLTRVTYVVTVHERSVMERVGVEASRLAQTGVPMLLAGVLAVLAVVAGVTVMVVTRLRHRPRHDGSGEGTVDSTLG